MTSSHGHRSRNCVGGCNQCCCTRCRRRRSSRGTTPRRASAHDDESCERAWRARASFSAHLDVPVRKCHRFWSQRPNATPGLLAGDYVLTVRYVGARRGKGTSQVYTTARARLPVPRPLLLPLFNTATTRSPSAVHRQNTSQNSQLTTLSRTRSCLSSNTPKCPSLSHKLSLIDPS